MRTKEASSRRAGDGLSPPYDLSGLRGGKHAKRYKAGSNLVVLSPDVARYYPNDRAVNAAPRPHVGLGKTCVADDRRVTRCGGWIGVAPAEVRTGRSRVSATFLRQRTSGDRRGRRDSFDHRNVRPWIFRRGARSRARGLHVGVLEGIIAVDHPLKHGVHT